MKKTFIQKAAVILCMTFLAPMVSEIPAKGADISFTITLEQAKKLAFASSSDYKRISGSIALKMAEYAQAVKSVQAKKLDMATFRWTPLLSFKFPEQPDLAQAYEWQYKPVQIQAGIKSLRHELNDVQYKLSEEVSNLYVKVYTAQEKINYNNERLSGLKDTIEKNKARVMAGEGKEADVEKMQKSYEKTKNDLALLEREYDNCTAKLSDYLKIDVSMKYIFENPFITANIDRDILPRITEYTLENDQGFYETKLTAGMAKTGLELNDSLMSRKYGSKMNIIRPYINQAMQGQEVDAEAFKLSYDQFLDRIDAPWRGSFKILFIKISKEWLKGAVDGIRYVEDEPYALYTAALEYQELLAEEQQAEKELKERVSDDFETLVTAWNAYKELERIQEEALNDSARNLALNQAGKLAFDELSLSQESAKESRIDTLEALASYSELLYSYDRLTCGAVTVYLKEGDLSSLQISGGSSYADETGNDSPGYYIQSRFEDQMFEFGVILPEGGAFDADTYELWIDGTLIGGRTKVTETIRHLRLTMEKIDKASVRFYKGSEQIGEYEFDPGVTEGKF